MPDNNIIITKDVASALAEKLADGGGHEAAAGSLLNDTIINITKLLQPIEL